MFNNAAELPHSPYSGPVYSNIGYNLLGMALANVYSKTFEQVIQDLILDPLNLTDTTFVPPTNRTEAFLPNSSDRWFVPNFGNYNPTGGIWSTPNDLMKFARSILDNGLLSPVETRKWLRPRSLVPSLFQLVGAPWEIYRPNHLPLTNERPVDQIGRASCRERVF